MRGFEVAAALALAGALLSGCQDDGDKRDKGASAAPLSVQRIERDVQGQHLAQTVNVVPDAAPALVENLRAASTVNVDAEKISPRAAEAIKAVADAWPAWTTSQLAQKGEGVALATSEFGARWSFDGYPVQRIDRNGKGACLESFWYGYEVLAVRLGKVVMKESGIAPPAAGGK